MEAVKWERCLAWLCTGPVRPGVIAAHLGATGHRATELSGGRSIAGSTPVPIRPIAPGDVPTGVFSSANHMFPSDPGAIAVKVLSALSPTENSLICPAIVTRPIAGTFPWSANHICPSGPGAIATGPAPEFKPAEYWVIWPSAVIRPMTAPSANHRLPSGPGAIPWGLSPALALSSTRKSGRSA